jgi:hypothetical protein
MRSWIAAIVIIGWVLLFLPYMAIGQTSAPANASTAANDYRRGYDAGYAAGLRAAKASLAAAGASALETPPGSTLLQSNPQLKAPLPASVYGPMPGPHALLRDARDYIMGKDAGPENTTVFPHSDTSPFWMSGQINFIFQWHPSFYAAYSGTNSFRHASEQALSRYLTLYTGAVLTPTTEGIFDLESAGGSGLSDALGIAGYPNLDVVRNPELSAAPYMARVWLRQVIRLSNEIETVPRTPLSMLTQLPVRRLDIHIGDMSLPDFFDINPVGSDSHMQFMNWAIDNDPAWDYAADTRGYTWAIVIEYWDRNFALRFADALEPTTANGINLQWDLQKAHSEN